MPDLMTCGKWLNKYRNRCVHLCLPGKRIIVPCEPHIVSKVAVQRWLHRLSRIFEEVIIVCKPPVGRNRSFEQVSLSIKCRSVAMCHRIQIIKVINYLLHYSLEVRFKYSLSIKAKLFRDADAVVIQSPKQIKHDIHNQSPGQNFFTNMPQVVLVNLSTDDFFYQPDAL